MSRHTPTPYQCSSRDWRNNQHPHHWYITGDHREHELDGDEFVDGDGERSGYSGTCVSVAIVVGNETAGDATRLTAEFLCLAANCHGDLLAACQAVMANIGRKVRHPTDPAYENALEVIVDRDIAIKMVEAAIAKATEGG